MNAHDNDSKEINQILMQFGPLHGNVERQEIHTQTTPGQEVASARENECTRSEVKMLTNRQLVILFQQLLNVPLSSESTNISALARLISRVSGGKESSIRTQINNMKDIDFSDRNVAVDIQEIADLLEDISKEVKKNHAECLLRMSKVR